jgi:hypothetical protein
MFTSDGFEDFFERLFVGRSLSEAMKRGGLDVGSVGEGSDKLAVDFLGFGTVVGLRKPAGGQKKRV